jgi:hypothetical protein
MGAFPPDRDYLVGDQPHLVLVFPHHARLEVGVVAVDSGGGKYTKRDVTREISGGLKGARSISDILQINGMKFLV